MRESKQAAEFIEGQIGNIRKDVSRAEERRKRAAAQRDEARNELEGASAAIEGLSKANEDSRMELERAKK